jgi:predicted Abi (CAAX) family protease
MLHAATLAPIVHEITKWFDEDPANLYVCFQIKYSLIYMHAFIHRSKNTLLFPSFRHVTALLEAAVTVKQTAIEACGHNVHEVSVRVFAIVCRL